MKKSIYSFLIVLSILVLIINIFIKSRELTNIIIFSINLFIKNILPSIFPMFVLSNILVEIDFPKLLGSFFNKLFKKLFKTPGASSFVFFMSMITGFPSSAKYINDLIDEEIIDSKEAQKILLFTFFSNPLFIVNTVGSFFLHSSRIGFLLLFSHVFGNIITGLIFRNYMSSNNDNSIDYFSFKNLCNSINNTNIFRVTFKSIKNSLEILVNIFGIVTFFLIIVNIILGTPDSYIEILITGMIEMTTGLKYLSISNYPRIIKIITSSFFLSFGGLSVHAQIMDILKEKKVKYLPFLLARIIQVPLSCVSVLAIFEIGYAILKP